MTSETAIDLTSLSKRFSQVASVTVALISCAVLLGWAFDIAILKNIFFSGAVAMQSDTALAFVLSALSLWLLAGDLSPSRLRIARLCAAMVILIGLLTLAEHLLGWDLRMERILFNHLPEGEEFFQPGRTAPGAAIMLLLLGVELSLLATARADWIIQSIALATGTLPLVALTGYLSWISGLFAVGPHAAVAPLTALNFIALSLGVLCARPGAGFLATVTGDNVGGAMARRLVPGAVGIPLILGCLTLLGQKMGLYDFGLGLALFALSTIVCFVMIIFSNARALAQQDSERREAEKRAQLNLKRIRALHEIDLALTSTLEVGAIQDVLSEKIELVLPFAAAITVRLLNRESGEFESPAPQGPDEEEWRAQENRALGGRGKKVLETKAPWTVRNIQTDPVIYHPEIYRKHGLVSYLGVPLIAKGEAIGVLGLYTREERVFIKEEIELLSTLADKAAMAIYHARPAEKIDPPAVKSAPTNSLLKESLKLLPGLYAALAPLSASEFVPEIINGIIEKLLETTGADAGLLRVWKKETGATIVSGHRGFSDNHVRQMEVGLLGGAAEWIVQNGEPIVAPDIASEPRFKTNVQVQLGFRSSATLPLKIHNHVRGIIHLSSRKPGHFAEEQKDLLVAIAQQMGVALENRELFDHLKVSKDELEKASKVKDEFLSVMSHELRTPLSVVMGYAGLLKEKMLGDINPQQDQCLQKLLTRANDQLNMINAIMQTTQLEAHALVLEPHLVNLPDLIAQIQSDLGAAHEKPQVALVWEYSPEPAPIVTDSGKVKQILLNLISNAIKFTNQGTVKISMRLTDRRGKNCVELKVADTGVGIAKEKMPGIFAKFFQVDGSETRLFGGVGLGLYIAKNFTDFLGGEMTVESEPGKGSTFTVTIPYAS